MAWGDVFTNAWDWSAASEIVLIYLAVAERQRALAVGSWWKQPILGADVQYGGTNTPPLTTDWPPATSTGTFSMRAVQDWIETNCTSFVRYEAAGEYDGASDIPYYTWSTLKADALSGNEWTRKLPDGAGGTTTTTGKQVPGDYIGPWLFNEAKAALNMLVLRRATLTWYIDGLNDGDSSYFLSDPDVATLKAAVEAAWPPGETAALTPIAATNLLLDTGVYYAFVDRTRGKPIAAWNDLYGVSVEYYVRPVAHVAWDNNGDWNDSDEDTFALVETKAFGVGGSPGTANNYVGAAPAGNFPVWCDTPVGDLETKSKGWQTGTAYAVIRYDVSGGFTYY